jgi:hypothetical protein
MPTWIVDDPSVAYIIAGVAVLVFVVGWWNTRKTWLAWSAVASVAAIAVIALLSIMVDSDSKRVERSLSDMAAGVENQDLDRIFHHVASTFRAGSMDREAFRRYADRVLQSRHPHGIIVWDVDATELSRDRKSGAVFFKVKGEGLEESEGVTFYNVRSTFVLEPDGQWRMQDFQLFIPTVDPRHGEPLALPGLGRSP